MRNLIATAACLTIVAVAGACGGTSRSTTSPSSGTSVAGTWTVTASDSTTAMLGAGGMMGQGGMGAGTWQLTQNGSTVAGSMSYAGMPGGMMRGTFSGTMSGDEMAFTMDMPAGMMSGACSAHATGIARMTDEGMTMTGSYSGTNSCAGAFTDGHMSMTRR